jgi:hypothetical protein
LGHQKNKESTRGDRTYRETDSEIFLLYALVAPTFRAKQLAWWLCGDLKSLHDLAAEIFPNVMIGKG